MNTKELAQKIKRLNALYRAGTPEVSDSEYDALIEQWRELEPDADWFTTAEPAPVPQGRKRKLPIPMKSLNKVKSLGEVKQWLNSLAIPASAKVVVTPKFDGVSWLHDEETGETYSRGGSENEGQTCLQHYIKGNFDNPCRLVYPSRFTFGELVFSREKWEKEFSNKKSDSTGELYRSPRNTVAGFINRDEAPDLIRHTTFFRYGIEEKDIVIFHTYTELYDELCLIFNQPNLKRTIQISELTEELLSACFKEWRNQFYIDGLVIYLDDLNLWAVIGRQQTTGNPLYAMAYKHPDFTYSFETTVKGIEWKVSKAGALKPVVNIEAVDTGDCTMENPTGYNALWIKNNSIGKGAKILVTRSGGVIPKILETLIPADPDIPQACPCCGGKLIQESSDMVCTNPLCPGIQLAKIVFFFKTIGIEGVGEETLTKFFKAGYDTIQRILSLSVKEIIHIEGFGEDSANAIYKEIQKLKLGLPLTTLMHASDCFKGVGKVKADKFISTLSNNELGRFIDGTYRFPLEDSESITQNALREGYPKFYEFLQRIQIPPILPEKKSSPSSSRYQDMNICFSGVRDAQLEAAIIDGGGSIASGVSKKTTHLVVKDVSGGSSKISKAHQLGIPILDIESFKSKY